LKGTEVLWDEKKKGVAYTAIFEWGEDGSYDVSFPALAGCYSTGDSFMDRMSVLKKQ
jgi:predicted RNase H-like HicB family nuclease